MKKSANDTLADLDGKNIDDTLDNGEHQFNRDQHAGATASNTPFSLSVLTASRKKASKKLIPDENGMPRKDPEHHLGISSGKMEHVRVDGLEGLRELLAKCSHKQALVHGIPQGSTPGECFKLVRKDRYTGNPGTIARSKDCFSYPAGPRLIMFDLDPDEQAPVTFDTSGELMAVVTEVIPAFKSAGYLRTYSTSSAIKCKRTGEWLTPPKGMHVYCLVTGDVERFTDILKARLWNAGYGYCKLATPNQQTGVAAVLDRCIIDTRVFSPERMDYVAGAIIDPDAPFWQDRPPPDLHDGIVVDLDAIPDLTPEEKQAWRALVDAAKAALQPEREASAAARIRQDKPEISDTDRKREARAQLERADKAELTPDHKLYFDNHKVIAAGAITADMNGWTLADPQEPDYDGGRSTAKLYWNDGSPRIHSVAHGLSKTYSIIGFETDIIKTDVTGVTGVTSSNHAGSGVTSDVTPDVTDVTLSIPENKRPCFRVFEDFTIVQEHIGKLRPGVWLFGVKTVRGETILTKKWICGPLYVDAITRDHQSNNFGRLLRFRNSLKQWRQWSMPMALLRGSGEELRGELLSMGLEIDATARTELAQYLQGIPPKKRIHCALQTGWCDGAFVLPGRVIGPAADGVIFQAAESQHPEFAQAGMLERWQSDIARLAIDNPVLLLAVSSAFAGPLLQRCNVESGGFHFVGDSSIGKSAALKAACSVWGGADYRRSWRATANGLEGAAALFNDLLMALDEISECDPSQIGPIVYSLANGLGKQRANRYGNARSLMRWRTFVLSSGERTLETSMAAGGHRVKAGQTVRLLNIPVARTFGIYDSLHDFPSGSALTDSLVTAAAQHHSHAGVAFLQQLTRDKRDFSAQLDRIQALPMFAIPAQSSGQHKRACRRFALVALAGKLAIEYGIVPWPESAALAAAAECYALWCQSHGGVTDETRQILDRVARFLERHGDSRFSEKNATTPPGGVRDRAGWWCDNGSAGRIYLFNTDGLREALKGFDFKAALDVLQAVGALPPSNSRGERAKSERINGRVERVYAIHADKLGGADDN